MRAAGIPAILLSGTLASLLCVMLACSGFDTAPPPTVAIAKTQNPLVASYSISSGCEGQAMVEFGPDTSYGRRTAWQQVPGRYRPAQILVAGMKASTTYHMRSTFNCFGDTRTSEDQTFTTGPLPSTPFTTIIVTRPNPSLSAKENPGVELINARATELNRHGAAIKLQRELLVGSTVGMRNQRGTQVSARIVKEVSNLEGLRTYGIEFVKDDDRARTF